MTDRLDAFSIFPLFPFQSSLLVSHQQSPSASFSFLPFSFQDSQTLRPLQHQHPFTPFNTLPFQTFNPSPTMLASLISTVALAAIGASAIQVTFPSKRDTWTTSGAQVRVSSIHLASCGGGNGWEVGSRERKKRKGKGRKEGEADSSTRFLSFFVHFYRPSSGIGSRPTPPASLSSSSTRYVLVSLRFELWMGRRTRRKRRKEEKGPPLLFFRQEG